MNIETIKASCKTTPTGCWEKIGVRNNGYGWFRMDGRARRAHRVSWEISNERPIPSGMYVCHRCNNKCCINPDHLYVATHRQNAIDAGKDGLLSFIKTPRGVTLENANKTSCKHGHALTAENTYFYPSGKRKCRECQTQINRAYKARNAESLRVKDLARYYRKAELAKEAP